MEKTSDRIFVIKTMITRVESGFKKIDIPILLEDDSEKGRDLITMLKNQRHGVRSTPVSLFDCTVENIGIEWVFGETRFLGVFENDQIMVSVNRSINLKIERFTPIDGRTFLMKMFLFKLLEWYGYNPLNP